MRRREALVGSVGLALSGCGYALVGRGILTDVSIKKIGVPLFKDLTGKPTLDQKVTAKVIEELLKRGRFDVSQQSEGVDALVEGEILQYTVAPVGFSGVPGDPTLPAGAQTTQASRYSVGLTARVAYRKVGEKEPIWQNEGFNFRDEYDIGSDPKDFFDREDQTIDRLVLSFARNLVAAMLEAF